MRTSRIFLLVLLQISIVSVSAVQAAGTVATPILNPNGKLFSNPLSVTISSATSGATIRYTTNGSVPTSSSSVCSGSISLSATTTVKAKAFKSGMTDSAVASATFTCVSVANFTGTVWPYPMPGGFSYSNAAWRNFLQVNYSGYTSIPIYANGTGLDNVTAVSTTAPGYTITLAKKTATMLTLRIEGARNSRGYFDETCPQPVANMPITFSYPGGSQTKPIQPGVIPTFRADLQVYGQCTWYAGYIARLREGAPVVLAYSNCVAISGDPNAAGFPLEGSVLSASGSHMAFLEVMNQTGMTWNPDNSWTNTYDMAGTQYNAKTPYGTKSPFTTQMVVKQKNGVFTITKWPTVIYTVTGVKH